MKTLLSALCSILLIVQPAFAINSSIKADNPVQLICHASEYARIVGTVSNTNIYDKSKVIYLNFGKNFNTSLSAVIYNETIPSFINAGIDEPTEYYKNKKVSIEGIIRISNGKPELIINSPDQIKVLN